MVSPPAVQDFTLSNQEGDNFNFYDSLDHTSKGMVIFTYPKANTPGCTKQACGFRDYYDDIKSHGFSVIGISKDKPAAQASWKKTKNLPYDLLSDEDGQVLKQLGCLSGNSTTRSVFIVDKETRSLVLDRVKISPEESVAVVVKMVVGEVEAEESASAESEEVEEGKRDKFARTVRGKAKAQSEQAEENKADKVVRNVKSKAKAGNEEAEENKADKVVRNVKSKAKAKASSFGRGRPPMEKKVLEGEEEEEEIDGFVAEKKVPVSRRVLAKRSDSTEASMKKAPVKKSVKRNEPTGGADENESSVKGSKRPKKATTASSPEEDSAAARAASQPRPSRVTRKGAEKAGTTGALKEEIKVRAKKTGASATPRSASTTASKKSVR